MLWNRFQPASRVLAIAVLATSFVTAAHAQSTITGNWIGTYNFSVQLSNCSNQTFSTSGNATVTFLQTGKGLVGRMDRTNVLVFNGACTPVKSEVTSSIVGTIDGGTVSWHFPNNSGGPQFDGAFDGSTITAQVSNGAGGTGSLTLSRAAADPPSAALAGNWSGTYSFTDRCSNGATQAYTGSMSLGLSSSGGAASGVMNMTGVPLYDQSCKKITTLNQAMAVAGVVSGTTFTGGVFDPSGSFEFPVSGTIGNGTLTGSVNGASQTSTTGTFTLTQSNATAPAADLAGSYEGTYTEVDNDALFCANVGNLSFSGPASLSLVQSGNLISGALLFEDELGVSSDGFGGCAIYDAGQAALPFYGTLSGNTLTTNAPFGGTSAVVTVTFKSDGSASGTFNDSYGDVASFSLTRTASGTPVTIQSFKATPSAVVPGQPATLSWSTANASTVSIDNGIGAVPASGSVSVQPMQTTTYTLTATGPNGTVTASSVVTVFPPGPRRRSAHP